MSQESSPLGFLISKNRPLLALKENAPHQPDDNFLVTDRYELAIIEFDDQGRSFNERAQLMPLVRRLEQALDEDLIVLVFVHGWRHNAESADENLADFKRTLQATGDYELHNGGSRKVLGIFIGWRGLSLASLFAPLELLTFWRRQKAGRRVAVGSVREVFGRLRRYRNHRIDKNGSAVLVIVGHSFGGMIVYSALAQSLIEAASTPPEERVVSRYADLVLLVNPAIEGIRYLPVFDLVTFRGESTSRIGGPQPSFPPIFMSVTSQSDWATKYTFPLGNYLWRLTQSLRGWQEREASITTIGHIKWMNTHELVFDQVTGNAKLNALAPDPQPFWVVSATPEVINGHNDIFNTRFLKFLADQVFAHVKMSRMDAKTNARKPK